MNKDPHIQDLLRCVEEKIGRKPDSPTNFDYLAIRVHQVTGESVSVSTLKRMWGYVSYTSQPSTTVLSVLSRFVGHRDWESFKASCTEETESGFLTGDVVKAADLKKGDVVELEWKPDRYCRIECMGNNRFRVVESRNSKIFPGNTFRAELAGERHGLGSVKVTREK